MRKPIVLLTMLFVIGSQAVMATDTSASKRRNALAGATSVDSKGRAQDGASAPRRVSGIFQNYDSSRNVVRISDVDYDLATTLAEQGHKLRAFRNGQTVLFTQSGNSNAGRNVLVSVESQ